MDVLDLRMGVGFNGDIMEGDNRKNKEILIMRLVNTLRIALYVALFIFGFYGVNVCAQNTNKKDNKLDLIDGFNGFKWGASFDSIKKKKPNLIYSEEISSASLVSAYVDVKSDDRATVYHFIDDELVSGTYLFLAKDGEFFPLFVDFCLRYEQLFKKYGRPTKNDIAWHTSAKNRSRKLVDNNDLLAGLTSGEIEEFKHRWRGRETSIVLSLTIDLIRISYYHRLFAEQRKAKIGDAIEL